MSAFSSLVGRLLMFCDTPNLNYLRHMYQCPNLILPTHSASVIPFGIALRCLRNAPPLPAILRSSGSDEVYNLRVDGTVQSGSQLHRLLYSTDGSADATRVPGEDELIISPSAIVHGSVTLTCM